MQLKSAAPAVRRSNHIAYKFTCLARKNKKKEKKRGEIILPSTIRFFPSIFL
jgi:hypothetical protein